MLAKLRVSALSDIYVTCQLVADNKPLTIPFRTSSKAFTKDYTYANIKDHNAHMCVVDCSDIIGGMNGLPSRYDIVTSH